MQFEWTKYKRVFAFGCSFTGYKYPTWANIMSKNMPKAKFYNASQSGGGNMYIASRITEVNRKYEFCESDLVMLMWSTFCREDRWVKNRGWITPGNIYTQNEYDFTNDAYLCNWADPTTFLVRDLAIIDITTTYLNNLPCDTLRMLSVPFEHQQDSDNNPVLTELLTLYKDLESAYPTSMYVQMNRNWGNSCAYYNSHNRKMIKDYHPSPKRYCNYLQSIGIEISDEAITYADDATAMLAQIKEESQFSTIFPGIDPRINNRDLI